LWLYPLSACLWLGGVVVHYPPRLWNLARKQWRIAGKRTHNMRKRLRRVRTERSDASGISGEPSERPERSPRAEERSERRKVGCEVVSEWTAE
jgi:hypothetical protein